MEGSRLDPRAALRALQVDGAAGIELDPGVNVLVTGAIDATLAREIVDACRSSRAEWAEAAAPSGAAGIATVSRITRSELELRAARVARARAHREPRRDTRPSALRAERVRARLEQLREQGDALLPELDEARTQLANESDLRDRIGVACDVVEFAMLDDAEGEAYSDEEAYERVALEWELFAATREAEEKRNREAIAAARRALDAVTARQALSGAIGTIDAETMDRIRQLHQRHQEAAQLLETARRNQRQERTRQLEESAAAERAALTEAGLDSYSDFLMLRVRSSHHDGNDDRLQTDRAAAQAALDDAAKVARAAYERHEALEIDIRARAAALLGRLPAEDVASDLRDAQAGEHAKPPAETPSALVELAALCRQADLDTGTDPVAAARAWLRAPSEYARTVARIETEMAELEREHDEAVAELAALEAPEGNSSGETREGVESVAGAIRGLLSRGALVPNATRAVDIDPPVITGLRDALAAIDREERGSAPVLFEYPWEGEADAITGRMLSVFRDAATTRQIIVIASGRYPRPVPDVHWIDVARSPEPEGGAGGGGDEPADPPEPHRRWASSLG